MIKSKNILKSQLPVLILLFMVLVQSCITVRLIGEYDEIIDNKVTELQENISGYFVKLERTIGTDEAKYENFVQQFDEIKVDLNILEIRAATFDKYKIIQDQITELKNMVENLEALHKLGFSSYEMLKPAVQPFNSAFKAIIKLQLALKRGEKIRI